MFVCVCVLACVYLCVCVGAWAGGCVGGWVGVMIVGALFFKGWFQKLFTASSHTYNSPIRPQSDVITCFENFSTHANKHRR